MDEEGRKIKKNEKRSPGLMVNLNDRINSLLPIFFDGFKVTVNRILSKHFHVSHSTYLSSITPGCYRFGATYIGTKWISPKEMYPVLHGDINSEGHLNASIYHLFGSRFKSRFNAQMQHESFSISQVESHYLGDDLTASVLLLNPNFLERSGCMLVQVLGNVTTWLSLGAEVGFITKTMTFNNQELAKKDFGRYMQTLSLCARYNTPNDCLSCLVSVDNILISYFHQASEQLAFGMEINSNLRTNDSVGTVAYQVELTDNGIVFKGMVDTHANVGSVFEKRISGTPFACQVSCNLNHLANNFRLGLGFTVN